MRPIDAEAASQPRQSLLTGPETAQSKHNHTILVGSARSSN
jgi:hypothetical protein